MRHLLLLCTMLLLIGSCRHAPQGSATMKNFDIQGHRGCRGLMPENTVTAMLHAVDLGVSTLELDVVVSRDSQILLSHEPWLSPVICRTPEGQDVAENSQEAWNLFQMDYAEIRRCDCGSRVHPGFPEQRQLSAHKPLLSEVIEAVEARVAQRNLPKVRYNIETKSDPRGDGLFHPTPDEFVRLLLQVVEQHKVADRCMIQSFDPRTLRAAREQAPEMSLVLLVEGNTDFRQKVEELGFEPHVYSPEWKLVNPELREWTREQGMKLIPWTVNEVKDMRRLISLGVDGIITDYPDRLVALLRQSR